MELTFAELDMEESEYLPNREVMCSPCYNPCYSPCGPSVSISLSLCLQVSL
jgi:hypothetical protein